MASSAAWSCSCNCRLLRIASPALAALVTAWGRAVGGLSSAAAAGRGVASTAHAVRHKPILRNTGITRNDTTLQPGQSRPETRSAYFTFAFVPPGAAGLAAGATGAVAGVVAGVAPAPGFHWMLKSRTICAAVAL